MNDPFQQSTFLNLVVVNSLDDLAIYKGQPNTFVPISCVENLIGELQSKIETLEHSSQSQNKTNIHNGHEYVDLGLPSGLLWATCNIGATQPEEYGDYFAWGETEPKQKYDWDTYKFSINGSDENFSKYTSPGMELENIDDAAHVLWGGNWRMPTQDEQYELSIHCKWFWIENYKGTGINGCFLKSETNGNTIFLPVNGKHDSDSFIPSAYYWSRSLNSQCIDYANVLDFDINDMCIGVSFPRCVAQSVRAVCPRAEYFNNNIQSKICSSNSKIKTNIHNGHEYVDLGLPSGILWATCNIGASSHEECGGDFAWGGTKLKQKYNEYGRATYKFYFNGNFAKYTTPGMELEDIDDAAHVLWGGNWRMPTKDEQDELCEYCEWIWMENYQELCEYDPSYYMHWRERRINLNGVRCGNGYFVKSKINGNSIFLPAGLIVLPYGDNNGYFDNSIGGYWSRSLDAVNVRLANSLSFNSRNVHMYLDDRDNIRSVRPVCSSAELNK